PGYVAIKPKALAKKLGVTKKHMEEFNLALAEAEASGELKILTSGRIQAKVPNKTYVGIVRKILSGDAFIILHEPRPTEIEGDVFIEAGDLKDAQNGDEVLFKLSSRRRGGGKRTGYVLDIVQRATNVFVGTYFEDEGTGWVQIDGKDYRRPIMVGDPGAKGAEPGDKVVIEMLRFPAGGETGEAVLTKVLGPRGEPGVDTTMILHEFGIPHEFPEEVLEDARLEAENFREGDLTDRDDLTGLTIITIDPVDARDFDDAISLERWENGHWHLGVHIADVSHFVQPGTALDEEAQKRGTSVYLPTQVVPMLPEVISNGLASLQENRVRFTMSAFIEFSPEGIPVGTRFSRSAIRVTRRFAYEEVLPILADLERATKKKVTTEVYQQLQQMHELAMLLRRRRFSKGALELDMPEVKVDLNKQGKVTGAHVTVNDESHQIIEEFMLAANIAVATELNDRGLLFLRRIHPDPAPQKLEALGEFASHLGYPVKRTQSRKDLQKLLDQVRGRQEEEAINFALLRSLKQAEYSPIELGHYALAELQYCHFTSPIRRYPDLLIHRLMESVITGRKSSGSGGMEEMLRMGRHCSTTERRAERAERELTKIKLLSYFEGRVGERMSARITGIDRFGFFCRGMEIPAEGLVHISTISDRDYFDFDRATMSLISRKDGKTYQLGNRVVVEVSHVDVDRRELNFKLIGFDRSVPKQKPGPATEIGKTRRSKNAKNKKGGSKKKGNSAPKRRRKR
ncbi:MAG TPA: ribonuclease R, partial [Planctomicrobium sp.]|nr:ribonuclease R [Planctomicrobium sp.]